MFGQTLAGAIHDEMCRSLGIDIPPATQFISVPGLGGWPCIKMTWQANRFVVTAWYYAIRVDDQLTVSVDTRETHPKQCLRIEFGPSLESVTISATVHLEQILAENTFQMALRSVNRACDGTLIDELSALKASFQPPDKDRSELVSWQVDDKFSFLFSQIGAILANTDDLPEAPKPLSRKCSPRITNQQVIDLLDALTG